MADANPIEELKARIKAAHTEIEADEDIAVASGNSPTQIKGKRVYVLRVSRSTWFAVFYGLGDVDLKWVLAALKSMYSDLLFNVVLFPYFIKSPKSNPINYHVVEIQRNYYPIVPETAEILTNLVNDVILYGYNPDGSEQPKDGDLPNYVQYMDGGNKVPNFLNQKHK